MMMNCTELICPLQARQLFTFWASSNIFTLLIVGMVSFISFRTGLISVHVVCCDAQNEKRFYTEDTLLYTLYDGWFSWYLLAFWARSIGCFVTYFLGVWSWANCFSFFFWYTGSCRNPPSVKQVATSHSCSDSIWRSVWVKMFSHRMFIVHQ